MRKVSLALLLIFAAGLGSAEAGIRENSWELGASVTHVDGDRDAGVDNGVGGTIRCGYAISEKLQAEVLFSANSADVDPLLGSNIPADFRRGMVNVVGNFLNDRGYKHVPYISAGLGVINATVEPFTNRNDDDVPEAFDSAALLTIAVGSRYFFTENWGARYELRYFHHDAFEEGQDIFVIDLGVSFVLGGQQ